MSELDQLIQQLGQDNTPVKPSASPWKLAGSWLAIAGVYITIALWLTGVRTDLSIALTQPWYLIEILLLLLLLITTALSAAVLAFPDLYQQRWLSVLPTIIFIIFIGFLISAEQFAPFDVPPLHSYQCCLSILVFSILPAIGIFFALRQLASTHPQAAGAVATLFSFTTGAIWLRLNEMTNSIHHLITWHYLPMLAIMLLGAWLGRKLLYWKQA